MKCFKTEQQNDQASILQIVTRRIAIDLVLQQRTPSRQSLSVSPHRVDTSSVLFVLC